MQLDEYIKSKSNELKHSTNESERMSIVVNAINGIGIFSAGLNDKIAIMFHETVLVGLTLLQTLKNNLDQIFEHIDIALNITPSYLATILVTLNSNLIKVSYVDNHVFVDSSKLKDVVQKILSYCSDFFNKFRLFLDKDLIDKYENSLTDEFSIAYLQTTLLREIIDGKYQDRAKLDTEIYMGNLNIKLEEYFKAVADAGDSQGFISSLVQYVYNYNIYGDTREVKVNSFLYPLVDIGIIRDDKAKSDFGSFIFDEILPSGATDKYYHIRQYGNLLEAPYNGSLFDVFNTLVYQYLSMFISASNKKIYEPLISQFATGYANNAIFENESTSDIFKFPTGYVVPAGGSVENLIDVICQTRSYLPIFPLYSSLAGIIKVLVSERDRKDNLKYIETDINNVPVFIKDAYRTQLPLFVKLFKQQLERCSVFKNIINRCISSDKTLYDLSTRANALAQNNNTNGLQAQNNNLGSLSEYGTLTFENVIAFIDKIISYYTGLLNCSEQVMREVDDNPSVFELYYGFIRDYEARNNKMPVMPFSEVLSILKIQLDADGRPTVDGKLLQPVNKLNTMEFKLQSGSRLLIGDMYDVKLQHMPWVSKLLAEYNSSMDVKYTISASDLDTFYGLCTMVYRDSINYCTKRIYSSAVGFGVVVPANKVLYQFLNSEEACITLVESSENKEKELASDLVTKAYSGEDKRASAIVKNILEMELIPINIYMLMRDVPLIFIHIYSKLLDNILNKMNINRKDEFTVMRMSITNIDVPINNVDVLRTIVNPTGYELGMPKFLVEQVYNKLLLQTAYAPIIV